MSDKEGQMVRIMDRLIKRFWIWRMRHNKEFMDGVKRGLESYHRGDVRPWAEVKKELGLK